MFHYVLYLLWYPVYVSLRHKSTVIFEPCVITSWINCQFQATFHYLMYLQSFPSHFSWRHISTVVSKHGFITIMSWFYCHLWAMFHYDMEIIMISESCFYYVIWFPSRVSLRHDSAMTSEPCFIRLRIYYNFIALFHYAMDLLWLPGMFSLHHDSSVTSEPCFITSWLYCDFRLHYDSTVISDLCFLTLWAYCDSDFWYITLWIYSDFRSLFHCVMNLLWLPVSVSLFYESTVVSGLFS